MNTDVRRNIFCVIMTSEDYLDAFEKLLRFVGNSHCSVTVCLQQNRRKEVNVTCLNRVLAGILYSSGYCFKICSWLCVKDGPEGQAGERDCSCSDGLLPAGEDL